MIINKREFGSRVYMPSDRINRDGLKCPFCDEEARAYVRNPGVRRSLADEDWNWIECGNGHTFSLRGIDMPYQDWHRYPLQRKYITRGLVYQVFRLIGSLGLETDVREWILASDIIERINGRSY